MILWMDGWITGIICYLQFRVFSPRRGEWPLMGISSLPRHAWYYVVPTFRGGLFQLFPICLGMKVCIIVFSLEKEGHMDSKSIIVSLTPLKFLMVHSSYRFEADLIYKSHHCGEVIDAGAS
jgi:hypothetical protein